MRITGRQLRQIIKEEVEKMMNEVDEIAVTDGKTLVDAVTQLEDSISNHIGQPLGAAVSAFVEAMKGKKNVVYATLMKEGGQLAQMGPNVGMVASGGERLNISTMIGVTKAILAANGKTNAVSTTGSPPVITVDGEYLKGPGIMGSGLAVANDEADLALSIGRFMFNRFGY